MKSRFLWVAAFSLLTSSPLLAENATARLADKPDEWFRSDEGKQTLDNVLSWQTKNGDWPKRDTTGKRQEANRKKLRGSFAGGATIGELQVLSRAIQLTDDDQCKQAFVRGIDHILDAQYENGGWPERYPVGKDRRHIAFKSNSMIGIMDLLYSVCTKDQFQFIDEERKASVRTALQNGIECILNCQVIVEGQRTVWSDWHHADSLAPVQDRTFDHPSLSGPASASVLVFLMQLEDPSLETIEAVKAGVAWYQSSKIEGYRYEKDVSDPALLPDDSADPLWARFYEIKTNRPAFNDKGGSIQYELKQIGEERRRDHTWYGKWGDKVLNQHLSWSQL